MSTSSATLTPRLSADQPTWAGTTRGRTPAFIRLIRHPRGPRLYILGRRVHHGSCALCLLPLLWRNRALRNVALAALLHDIRDFPWRDCDNH